MAESQRSSMRAERTKKIIIDAMLELMSEKKYERITINEIADRAMVNRNTFYMYFEDKAALLKKIFNNCLEDLKADEDKITDMDIRNASTLTLWYKSFLKNIIKYRTIYRLSLTSFEEAFAQFNKELHDYYFNDYLDYMKGNPKYSHFTEKQMALRADYLLGADLALAHNIIMEDENFSLSIDDIIMAVADFNYCMISPRNDFIKK